MRTRCRDRTGVGVGRAAADRRLALPHRDWPAPI